jgi:hypothetical protein
MHGVDTRAEFGAKVTNYRKRFVLRCRNKHPLTRGYYPIQSRAGGRGDTEVHS